MSLNYTATLTSCGRHDLLRETLESFCACADIVPGKTVIVEDDPTTPRPAWLENIPLPNVVWIQNPQNMGQARSIDRAYEEVETEYIFHSEDDWQFLKPGPIMAESKAILEKYPNVSMVALTNHQAWMFTDPAYTCLLSKPSLQGMDVIWDGTSFNPGLRRLSDYKKLGRTYQQILGRRGSPEAAVASLFHELGYVMADLGTTYIRHTGCERRCPTLDP